MTLKCDLQYGKGDAEYKLTRVGVKGVRKPIVVQREGASGKVIHNLNCQFDIYVDLPKDQKGSHMSRNVEVLNEIVADSVENPITAVENVAVDILKRLMVHHEYAKEADVHIEAEYFRESKTPLGKNTFEAYTLISGGHLVRGGSITKKIGVKVVGMTACPCGQQTVTEMLEIQSDIPVMTHNQRNIVTLMMYMPEEIDIEANDLIDLVEESFSSPTYELLKRPDEGQVIINAHYNTKFVEDVVRTVLDNLVKRYKDVPDEVFVDVTSDSEESIHKHDAFAEREATMGDLRRENNRGSGSDIRRPCA